MTACPPDTGAPRPVGGEALRDRLAAALRGRERRRIPEEACEARAAVALVLRPDSPARDPGREPPAEVAEGGGGASVLFVQRAEADGDPWSGHMALPGGRRSAGDPDLVATAIRETREETSLVLDRSDVLGALDDILPRSAHLPAIAVTPHVAWYTGGKAVRGNREIRGHVWAPLEALLAPRRRSVLTLRRAGRRLDFPSIELGDYTVWGLTFEIVDAFLRVTGMAE